MKRLNTLIHTQQLIEEQDVPRLKIFSTRPLSEQDKAFLQKLHPDA
jgi:hypothetical protein